MRCCAGGAHNNGGGGSAEDEARLLLLGHHLVDFWCNICLCHSLIVEEAEDGGPPIYQARAAGLLSWRSQLACSVMSCREYLGMHSSRGGC